MHRLDIVEAINKFNGKVTKPLDRLVTSNLDKVDIDSLVDIARSNDPKQQQATTWIIKKFLESKGRLTTGQTQKLLKTAPDFKQWEATLHICQIVGYLQIPTGSAVSFYKYLENLTRDPKNLIRAWAYNALYEFAQQYPDKQNEVKKLLNTGLRDPAPSVRARLKSLNLSTR